MMHKLDPKQHEHRPETVPGMEMLEHLNQIESDMFASAIHVQIGLWRLWFEQLDYGLKMSHALMVSEALPDPMSDRSLWWSAKMAPFLDG